MKKELFISFLCGLMAVAGASCNGSNEPSGETKVVKKRLLTINTQQGAESPRRIINATINDEGTTLSSLWTAGDGLSYCNLSRQEQVGVAQYEVYQGPLTAIETKHISMVQGDVECTVDDYLAVVYPANNTFEFISTGTKYRYHFSLAGQDGTLSGLAANYHQVYGRAHVTAVTNKTADATMAKMQSLLTVCKFSFKDKTTNADIPVETLTIQYADATSENGKYPQKGQVTVLVTTENHEAKAEKYDVTAPLVVTCTSEQPAVYVALMPEIASRTYHFTVTNSEGTYSGTASAWLKEGEYVPATGLKLQKQ
ncbi:MAG: hypothetical protein II140_03685 [Paludibacteraceae bacterium]|nr:hypothetical protein [Paludibacteraceae bacterium]